MCINRLAVEAPDALANRAGSRTATYGTESEISSSVWSSTEYNGKVNFEISCVVCAKPMSSGASGRGGVAVTLFGRQSCPAHPPTESANATTVSALVNATQLYTSYVAGRGGVRAHHD